LLKVWDLRTKMLTRIPISSISQSYVQSVINISKWKMMKRNSNTVTLALVIAVKKSRTNVLSIPEYMPTEKFVQFVKSKSNLMTSLQFQTIFPDLNSTTKTKVKSLRTSKTKMATKKK
jgi:hypothetical protein